MTESEQLPGKIIAMHCQTIQELTAKLARLRQSNAVLLAALKSALRIFVGPDGELLETPVTEETVVARHQAKTPAAPPAPSVEVALTDVDQRRMIDEFGELDRRRQLHASDDVRYERWLVHQAGSAIAKACRLAEVDAAALRRADNLRWAAVAKLAGLERTGPHFPCDQVREEAIRLLEVTK